MRKEFVLAITIFIILFSNCVKTELTHALTPLGYTVKAMDDTHVDSTKPDSVLGGEKYLDVESWGDSPTSNNQIIWLKFSLSDIPDGVEFSQATMQVYVWSAGTGSNISAYYCSDNSWTESTLTYSNMPSYATDPIDTEPVTTSAEWYSWNVVEAVRSASNSNLDAVTVVLNEPPDSQNSVFMYSKETPSLVMDVSPKLTLSWSLSASPTPKITPNPSFTSGTPTPLPSSTLPTNLPTPTPTSASGTPINWAVWGILILVIIVVVFLAVYILAKRRRKQLPEPPPPPPPPPEAPNTVL